MPRKCNGYRLQCAKTFRNPDEAVAYAQKMANRTGQQVLVVPEGATAPARNPRRARQIGAEDDERWASGSWTYVVERYGLWRVRRYGADNRNHYLTQEGRWTTKPIYDSDPRNQWGGWETKAAALAALQGAPKSNPRRRNPNLPRSTWGNDPGDDMLMFIAGRSDRKNGVVARFPQDRSYMKGWKSGGPR